MEIIYVRYLSAGFQKVVTTIEIFTKAKYVSHPA